MVLSSMESLPDEIIQQILTDPNLSIFDVVHFSSVSLKFRETVLSNRSLWKTKYFQRWPKTDFEIICEDWYNECTSRVHFEKQARQLLSSMSPRFLHLDRKKISGSQLDFILHLINSHIYGYYYLRDFLVAVNSLPLTEALTDKYYGNIIMKYIHKRHNTEVWNDLMQLNVQKQTLEKGAIFVTVWCQEYERGLWKKIMSELDLIASKVRSHLLQNFPDHPLKYTSEETQSRWKNENLTGNYFSAEDCESIIRAINNVLFEDLKFCISYDFNEFHKNRSGIDFALLDRHSNPYTFGVIYESVARRLGVKIEILEFPDDCLLRWKADYSMINSPSHYIRRSSGDIFLFPKNFFSDELIVPCNMQKVAQRAASYIHPRELGDRYISLRDALELQLLMKPFSLECYQQLSQTYFLHELDAKQLISKLKDIRNQLPNGESREFQSLLLSLELHQRIWERNHTPFQEQPPLVVQNRVEGVDFAVGMIVRDKFWEILGVIHGWSVDIKSSKNGRPIVNYRVLVEDGRYECTLQENLQILHSPPFISHPCIGRFFDEYCMTYYRANKELQAQYPQDMDALQKILKKDRLN